MIRAILLGIIICSVFVSPVAAQSAAQKYPLDQSAEQLDQVVLNGKTYTIYEYDNVLPYASGIEVVVQGERVTSRETVEEVFTEYSRQQCRDCFGPETASEMARIIEYTNTSTQTVNTTLSSLNETIEFTNDLRETEVNDTTAWKMAVNRSSVLDDTFEETVLESSDAEQLRNELIGLQGTLTNLNENATEVQALIGKKRAGESINQSKLYAKYANTRAAIDSVRTSLTDLQGDFEQMSEQSANVAKDAGETPKVGATITDRFTALSEQFSEAAEFASSVSDRMEQTQSELPTFAENEEVVDRMVEGWDKRQSAMGKIYATGIEIIIVLFAGLFAFGELR